MLWGGKERGRQKLYRTGHPADHERIVARLQAGKAVRWPVVKEVKRAAGVGAEAMAEDKECS